MICGDEMTREELLGKKILENCRNELYLYFPYLDGAFCSVDLKPDYETRCCATDGEFLYFFPEFLMHKYAENPAEVKKGYLHMLFHCLFLHIFQKPVYGKEEVLDNFSVEEIWNLACDISAEFLIDQAVREKKILNFCPENDRNMEIRNTCFSIMRKTEEKYASVHRIFVAVLRGDFPYKPEEMIPVFRWDDHRLWGKCPEGGENKIRRKWDQIGSFTVQNKTGSHSRAGTSTDSGEEELDEIYRSRYDYRKFLKRFSKPREEMELDPESFDYIFYHFGMEKYENLPLIEPLEYKEVNRLEELVIAIDTSGSCSRETVQKFLGETYSILSEKENFFHKMKVYIIQCDCCLQKIDIIHSEDEWKEYCEKVTIQGRGGTDFRPVFRYVQKQIAEREIKDLRALIYFTDGDGIYPQEKPDYETAFVFLKKTEKMNLVPSWALRLVTGQKEQKE